MRRRKPAAVFFALALSLGALISCSNRPDSWTGRIEVEDGIRVIHNTNKALASSDAITLASELIIGQETDGQGEALFRNLLPYGCVDTDASGRIFVLDSGADAVLRFDSQGEFEKSFGRRGQGPGEFQSAGCLRVMPDGGIMVVDGIGPKLVLFDADGTFVREDRIAGSLEIAVPAIDSLGGIVVTSTEFGERWTWRLVRVSPGLKDTITLAETATRRLFDGSTIDLYTPQFRFAVTAGDEIVWGFQNEYALSVAGLDGRVLRKIRKDFDPVPVTEAEFQARLKDTFGGRGAPQNVTLVRPASYWPFLLLVGDEDGRIMARTPEKSADGKMRYDLFGKDGRFAATIGIDGFPVLWKGGRLFVLEESPETGQVLRRMKIELKGI